MNKLLRLGRAVRGFVRISVDPSRLNEVFNLSDGLADPAVLDKLAEHYRRQPEGAEALRDQPRLHIDLTELSKLPEGTLGREFADHMIANGLDPAALPTLSARSEGEFVRAHLYESHDVWHVVTGFATDVAGELGLQAFYLAQAGEGKLPTAILAAGLVNTLLFAHDEHEARMNEIARGWQLGKLARPLFGVRWDRLWNVPLAEVRRTLGVAAVETRLAA